MAAGRSLMLVCVGLVTATLLTLLVLPAIYPWFRGSPGAAQHPGSIALRPAE